MRFKNQNLIPDDDETVLNLLLRYQVEVSYSCRSGNCQSCILQSESEGIVPAAQNGLKNTAKMQGHFMACQQPASLLASADFVDDNCLFSHAVLIQKQVYHKNLVGLKLAPVNPIDYHAGQFINLRHPQGDVRSYSIASLVSGDPYLELHVQKKTDGKMSHWLIDEFKEGQQIEFQGPIGNCFYTKAELDSSLIFIGNATGAAPLIGIVREALHSGHSGFMHFYHGAINQEMLYLNKELKRIQKENNNFVYHACVNSTEPIEGIRQGRCNDIAISDITLSKIDTSNTTRVYLCGNPEMVNTSKKKIFLAGIPSKNIFADPFEYKDLRSALR